jgi:anthranilate synthase component 1
MTATPVAFRTTPQSLYLPAFDEVARLFAQGDLVPVYRTLPADLDTPVSVFLKLTRAADEPAFLLESVEGGEQVARYSFLGVNPAAILTARGHDVEETRSGQVTRRTQPADRDPLDAIKAVIAGYRPVTLPGLPRFVGGAVGYLSYDLVRHFERLPATADDQLGLPDASFMLIDTLVIFDHVKHQVIVLANAHNRGDARAAYNDAVSRIEAVVERLRQPLPVTPEPPGASDESLVSNFTQTEYEDRVRRAKEYIAAGDAFQIVPSQRMARETAADPFTIYRALRMLNPSPYMFYLNFPADDTRVIGASPEMLVRFDADDRTATIRPIAGTAPRDPDFVQDQANAEALLADPKERAEHVMLVDLSRNDLGRVCEYGSVHVPQLLTIERFSHVMHIVSHVEGRVRPGLDAFDVLRASFPAGTLTGAPKIRAMEIIEELEGTRRGLYGGAVGYFSFGGGMDTCIAIRTLLLRAKRAYLQAGAGIVADSEPSREYQETLHKTRALAVAIDNAERGVI